ncbi:iron-containing redox enzyme family protein [Pseudomonas sp. 10B1]|uniref:iron-containing redox enzyme family protein n=2 Tax=Pseudomonas TaxID=286 RepID=UPI002AB441FF|nr:MULTISPECIES: iron-containing redox enzyme family protein [unclassified Pseudomonas]MDY7562380.1 iron-containing redox enzyme family protein [Pseudomonas sp. AB6]MEA9976416.1 iron-containing redox enzyme family protein [Pseudomonas sp. RTS4]MEA9994695.1 iron-containing redox enzyme family protein [Pseudomonas sp. AA4]MEB0086358.1 iron-containing redox enzyme family protein [Pseudomonas sp. RTI1]MEB0126443.1 iron-containing redox enzyme family protein [Pseudomonas sp. CCC1.2]
MEHALGKNDFDSRIACLGKFDIYRDGESWTEKTSVWKRPLRPQAFPYINFESVTRETLLNYSSFTMNRTMTALYEQDFLYLPDTSEHIVADLKIAYNPALRTLAADLIPDLELKVFGILQNEVNVGGEWNKELFQRYLATKLEPSTEIVNDSLSLIHLATDQPLMVRFLLMQHAVDFLPESSHMARFAKGDYGEAQSAMFRVLLDEFGYGKHAAKHSTLFKETLKSVGMLDNSHAYWNFYLNSSLLNNNYFHMLTRSPERFFEYVGAITYAENAFGPYCGRVKTLIQHVFTEADTRYYTEHVHIDSYHGSMTLNEILLPLADRFGASIYPDFVKGIEMACILQHIMEEDLCAQITWMNKRSDYRQLAMDIKATVLANIENIPVAHLNEPRGELSVPHVHDGDEFCIVDEGLLRFCHGPDCFSDLAAGECVVIARNRLHGALVLSENCKYRILSIGDYRQYATYSL